MTITADAIAVLPKIPPDSEHCNGRDDELMSYCEQPPGWGTEHPGEGRCKLHGGASPRGAAHPRFKHGQRSAYASVVTASVAEKMEALAEHDALDIIGELQLQRALLMDFAEGKRDGLELADRELLMRWAEQITRTAERMTRMRNDTAITAAELAMVAHKLAGAAEKYVPEDVRADFLREAFSALGVGRD